MEKPLSDIFEDQLLIEQNESNEETTIEESTTVESTTEDSTTVYSTN